MSLANWATLACLSLLWGGSFLFIEIALVGLPVLTIVWLRVAGAAALLGAWMVWTRASFPVGGKAWAGLFVMGALNNALPFTLFVLAQGQITGGLASIVNATTPLWTVIVAHLFTRDERVTGAKMLGLTLGFSGVALIAGGGPEGDFWAIMACLAAALSYGLAAVWGRRFRAMGMAPVQVAFGMLSASTLIIFPFWALGDVPWAMAPPPAKAVIAVAALAFFCTALAYILYFLLLARAGATMLSLVTFVIPAFALGLGAVVLGERVARVDLAGLGLILMGLAAMDGRVWQKINAAWRKA